MQHTHTRAHLSDIFNRISIVPFNNALIDLPSLMSHQGCCCCCCCLLAWNPFNSVCRFIDGLQQQQQQRWCEVQLEEILTFSLPVKPRFKETDQLGASPASVCTCLWACLGVIFCFQVCEGLIRFGLLFPLFLVIAQTEHCPLCPGLSPSWTDCLSVVRTFFFGYL